MTEYIQLDLPADSEEMREAIFDVIRERWPEWEPADGNLETWLAAAFAREGSVIVESVQEVAFEIFKRFGSDIAGIAADAALAASVTSTWTMVDNAGYTIEAGTEVGIPKTTNELIAFTVESDVVIPPGSTATAAGEVTLIAVEEGTNANDLSDDPQLITALDYVDSIALVGSTSGGQDAENDEDYANRLAEEFRLLTPTPILAWEFAVLALRIDGVERAVAVDGWDADTPATGQDRYVGLVLLDEDGADVDAGIKTEVEEYLDAMREVNFVVTVGSPTVNTIDVTTTVRAFETWDTAEVDAAVTAALEDFLSPTNWGESLDDPDIWNNTTTLRYLEVASVITAVAGVNYIESLSVEGGTANVALTGTVPVTEPGTIDVTVNAGP